MVFHFIFLGKGQSLRMYIKILYKDLFSHYNLILRKLTKIHCKKIAIRNRICSETVQKQRIYNVLVLHNVRIL